MKPDDLPMYPTPQQATYTIPPQASSQSSRRHASGPKPQAQPHNTYGQNTYSNGRPYQQPQYYQPAPSQQSQQSQQGYQSHQSHQSHPSQQNHPSQNQQNHPGQNQQNHPSHQPQQTQYNQYQPQYSAPQQYNNGYVNQAPPLHPSQAQPQYYQAQAQPAPVPAHSPQYAVPNTRYQQPPAPSPQTSRHGSSSSHALPMAHSPPQMSGAPQSRSKKPTTHTNRSRESLEESGKVSSKQRLEAELRATFERVDVNRSGRISTKELSSALMNFDNTGFQISTVRLMMKLFTSSSSTSSSSLNFEQFVSLWKYLSAYKKLFVAADVNKSGDISFGEFQRIIEQIGYKLNVDLVLHLFQKFANRESNDDGTVAVGKLKFDAFIELLVYLRKLTDIFKQFDKDLTGVATVEYSDFLYEISNLT